MSHPPSVSLCVRLCGLMVCGFALSGLSLGAVLLDNLAQTAVELIGLFGHFLAKLEEISSLGGIYLEIGLVLEVVVKVDGIFDDF